MSAGYLLQEFVNGLSNGAVYAIFALGYTLVFSILGILNLTQGAVFTVGGYFAYSLATGHFGGSSGALDYHTALALPFWLTVLAGGILAGLLGVLFERLVFRPLRLRGADPLLPLVASIGLSILLINLVQYFYGAQNHSFPQGMLGKIPPVIFVGPIAARGIQLVILAVALVLLLVLWIFSRSRFGRALYAVAENPTAASLVGISVDRYIVGTFFISGFLGGLAGALVGLSYSIGPYFGQSYELIGLAVIVLGGLDNIPGAVVGGLLLGVVESLVVGILDYYVSGAGSGYRNLVAFGLLLLVLMFHPQGIMGRRIPEKV